MTTPSNRPGPVLEEAQPIDAEHPASITARTQDSGSQQRSPGPVNEPARPMEPVGRDNNVPLSPEEAEPAEHGPWRVVFWLLVALLAIWLGYRTFTELSDLWHRAVWLAIPVTVLTLVLFGTAGLAIRREIAAMRRVDALPARSAMIEDALKTDSLVLMKEALSPTIAAVRKRRPSLAAEFEAAAANRDNVREYTELFRNLILQELDEEAEALIKRTAITVGTAVAVLPHPALDAAVVLWRATALVRRVGDIYGLELTGLSSLKLFRHIVTSGILAVGMEAAGDAVLDQIGRGALEGAGKMGAEGVVIAVRVYRLGRLSIQLCKPTF